ncbi:COG1470 family protein [Prauserella cavernicola]|uniref:DUF916 domain-containing protein n=1 Tax=Prauserella cavernicola TaxID=2800127 RepID=A0A934QTB8_9PSEU|nr:hypothetical protein [Prauserella cavernicola]MBK1785970.1 hypothetical protein [Prauserella cavernicola]
MPTALPRPRGRVLLAFAATAAAALGLTLGPLVPAALAAQVEWSVAPANGDGPDGRISLRHVADPGATVGDAIAVTNLGAEPAEFSVASGDGVLGGNGAFDIARGEPTGSGSWIRVGGLDDGGLTLAGGETRVLPVTVTIPDRATPGDHPAGIAVGVSSAQDGVTVQQRIGVRLHLRVAGELEPAVDVRGVETSYTPSWIPFVPGTLRVDYEVANTGNVRLGATTTLDAAGPLGLASAEHTGRVDELLPGDDVARSAEVTVFPLFALFGDLTATPLAVGEDQVPLPAAGTHSFTSVAVPWLELAVLVLVGLLVRRVVRRRRATASEPEREPVAAR